MEELHGYIADAKKLMSEEGQQGISCSNEVSVSCPPFDIKRREEFKNLLRGFVREIINQEIETYEKRRNES